MAKKTSKWIKCRASHLWRNRDSGFYYARLVISVPGAAPGAPARKRDVWRTLKTDSEATAKLRLPSYLSWMRSDVSGRHPKSGIFFETPDLASGASLGQCAELYLAAKAKEPGLKPRALAYRKDTFTGIRKTWINFDTTPAASVSSEMCQRWWLKAAPQYHPARANGMLQSLRGCLAVAVQAGLLADNPIKTKAQVGFRSAAVLEQLEVKRKGMKMVGFEEVNGILAALRRRKSLGFWVCRFLYHFSLRIGTARALTPAMAKRAEGVFEIPGDLVKNGVAGDLVVVPIFPEMEELLKELDKKFGKNRKFILPVRGCRRPLAAVCKALNIVPALTHHSFRHIFTSHALAKGVDYRIVAKWRNDADNGAFLLKHYSHLIAGIERQAVQGLRFRNGPDQKIHVLKLKKSNHG